LKEVRPRATLVYGSTQQNREMESKQCTLKLQVPEDTTQIAKLPAQ
jgi:hypothetical protein